MRHRDGGRVTRSRPGREQRLPEIERPRRGRRIELATAAQDPYQRMGPHSWLGTRSKPSSIVLRQRSGGVELEQDRRFPQEGDRVVAEEPRGVRVFGGGLVESAQRLQRLRQLETDQTSMGMR